MLTVPPTGSTGGHDDLAEPKSLDFQIPSMRGTGVVSGGVVAQQATPNMTLQVSACSYEIAGVPYSYAGGNVTITANGSANPRYDAVVLNTSNAAQVIAGTALPESSLDDPAVDLSLYCVLKKVYVPGGSPTAITDGELVDKRAMQNTGAIPDSRIPSGIARDTEVTAAVDGHVAASDPHGDLAGAAADAQTKANAAAAAAEGYADGIVATHVSGTGGQADPHAMYQKESEKDAASGYAGLTAGTVLKAAQMPLPTASTLGGVQAYTSPGNEFIKSIGTGGVPTSGVPATTDVSTDPTWDALGDLLVGNGPNAGVRLGVDAAGKILGGDAVNGVYWQPGSANFDRPTGAISQTLTRVGRDTANLTLVSGALYLVAIYLPRGAVVTSITFLSRGQALVSGTHQFFALYDGSRTLLRQTTDDGATAWAQNVVKTLSLTSSYTTTVGGLFYVGVCVVAATPPQLAGVGAGSATLADLAPKTAGASTTGISSGTAPDPAGAITSGFTPYAYVS